MAIVYFSETHIHSQTFWSDANPVDLVAEMNTDIHVAIADELLQWDECDAIIHMGIIGRRIMIGGVLNSTIAVDPVYDRKFKEDSLEMLRVYEHELVAKTVRIMGKYSKPVIGGEKKAKKPVR